MNVEQFQRDENSLILLHLKTRQSHLRAKKTTLN